MLYNSKKKKFHFLLANIWKPRMSKSDPEPANALYSRDEAKTMYMHSNQASFTQLRDIYVQRGKKTG